MLTKENINRKSTNRVLLGETNSNHVFIINPIAGRGKALQIINEIHQYFAATKVTHVKNPVESAANSKVPHYTIEITTKVGHATELAKHYSSMGGYRIYSVGGDGTLNEVLNGMVGSTCALAVIPCGSGNDFIRSIMAQSVTGKVPEQNAKGKSPKMTSLLLRNILESTIEGIEKCIDVGCINSRYFINISSVGFDAQVVHNSRRLKRIPFITGGIAYVLSIFATIFRARCTNIEITINDRTLNTRILLVAIANGKFYGGGMLPTPGALIDDGELDICMINEVGIVKILSFFPKLIKGTHGKLKEVSFYRGSKVLIKCDKPIAVNIDGETGRMKEIAFSIIHKGIRFVVPKQQVFLWI